MEKVFGRPACLKDKPFRYCPGCSHGVLHRIVAETISSLGVRDRTVGIAPVGCAVFAYDYFDIDMIEVPHGRPPAIATGMKRSRPECIVFSYQGDGDLAAIGTAEIVHAAARGENITVIFVNNGNYGMTGGQMAPTTLPGQKTTTTPLGRNVREAGNPLWTRRVRTSNSPNFVLFVSFVVKFLLPSRRDVSLEKLRLGDLAMLV